MRNIFISREISLIEMTDLVVIHLPIFINFHVFLSFIIQFHIKTDFIHILLKSVVTVWGGHTRGGPVVRDASPGSRA